MMRRLAVTAAALAISLCAAGIAIEPLKTPMFTRILVERYAESDEARVPDAEMARVAEQVRHRVVSPGRGGELPETVSGRPGFDESAVSHLDDVARVLLGARVVTLVLAVLLAAFGAAAFRAGAFRGITSALRASAGACFAVVVLAVFVATSDFDAFFAAFHGLFFAEGTWTFSYDALLIRLFPEQFWIAAGVSWGVVTIVIAGLLFAISGRIERHGEARAVGREG